MTDPRNQYEREEEMLSDELESGAISSEEYNKQMRELERDYAIAAEEAAQQAYERERDNW